VLPSRKEESCRIPLHELFLIPPKGLSASPLPSRPVLSITQWDTQEIEAMGRIDYDTVETRTIHIVPNPPFCGSCTVLLMTVDRLRCGAQLRI
jgi:hypothetical protein